jgi:Flp pilus assembly protein TadD
MAPDPYLEPLKARIRLARATAYRRLGFYDQADGDYAAAEQMVPDDPAIPFNRGLIAWWRGKRQEAVELCNTALERASVTLRIELLSALDGDPRYSPLLVRLKR